VRRPRRLRLNWLLEIARPKPAPIPWGGAVRSALAVAGPVAVGLALGRGSLGLIVATGALPAVVSDRAGTYRARTARMAGANVAAALGYIIGGLVVGTGWPAVVVPTLLAGLVTIASAIGSTTSAAGLQLLIYTIIASAKPFGLPWWEAPALVLLGGVWALGMAAVGWLSRPGDPERAAVAREFSAIADLLRAIVPRDPKRGVADLAGLQMGHPDVGPAGFAADSAARRALTDAMTGAYDSVYGLRLREPGRDRGTRHLLAVLHAGTPLVEAAVALTREHRSLPAEIPDYVDSLAVSLREHRTPGPPVEVPGSSPSRIALRRALATVAEVMNESGAPPTRTRPVGPTASPDGDPAPVATGSRTVVSRLLDRGLVGPATLRVAARVVLCVAAAEAVGAAAGLARSYWVTLTVASVIKPDFGSVFARAVQRGVGTVLGAVVGAGIVELVPSGPWLVPFLVVLTAALPIAIVRNYGLFTVFLTPVVIVLFDSVGHTAGLVQARVLDTVTGCAIVLVLGYAIWPETWRPHLDLRVADTADGVAAYAHRALRPDLWDTPPVRRRTYRVLADLRTVLQQTLAEPTRAGRQAAAWLPAIVGLERITDSITGAATALQHGRAEVKRADAEQIEAALRELGAAIREHRRSRRAPLPDTPALADVSRELRTMLEAITGPSERTRRTLRRGRGGGRPEVAGSRR
jgi:uncharacterized membrane protein YccC